MLIRIFFLFLLLPHLGEAISCSAAFKDLASALRGSGSRQALDELFDYTDYSEFEFPRSSVSPLANYFHMAAEFNDLKSWQQSFQQASKVPSFVRNDLSKRKYRISLLSRPMEEAYPKYKTTVIRGSTKFAAHCDYGNCLIVVGVNSASAIPHEVYHGYDHDHRLSNKPDFQDSFARDGGWKGEPYYNASQEAFAEGSAMYFEPNYRFSLLKEQPGLHRYFENLYGQPVLKERIKNFGESRGVKTTLTERNALVGKPLIYEPGTSRWYDPKTGTWYFVMYNGSPNEILYIERLHFAPGETPLPHNGFPRTIGALKFEDPELEMRRLRERFLGSSEP